MKLRSIFISTILAISFNAQAATQIAPTNRVNLFLDSTTPFTSSDWINATSTTIGSVKVVKSTGNTTYQLLLNFPTNMGISGSNKRFLLDSVNSLGSVNARISDTYNGYMGQCVDFAKSMIGSTDATSKWHAGTKLSDIPVNQRATVLRPGTMIAYFAGDSVYPSNGSGHVAIVLSVASDGSGVHVIDQNFVNGFALKVGTIQYAASSNTLIAKHLMPWTDTAPRRAVGEYHIVDLY